MIVYPAVDYVIRRFIASLARLQCLRGWTFAETPRHAILQVRIRVPSELLVGISLAST